MWLDECDDSGVLVLVQPSQSRGDGVALARPTHVNGDEVASGEIFDCVWVGVHNVGPLEHDDAAIVSQRPGESAIRRVDRVDTGGPTLQEAIRESAGAGPEVRTFQTCNVYGKCIERGSQLKSTT